MTRAILLLLPFTLICGAHVVVRPAESKAGQDQKYTLRLPNEKQIVTTSVELAIPAGMAIMSIDEVPGWKSAAMKDAQGAIVSVRWTGSLKPTEVVQFTFSAHNPAKAAVVEWKAVQTYQDGSKSEWVGPEGSKTPASRSKIN